MKRMILSLAVAALCVGAPQGKDVTGPQTAAATEQKAKADDDEWFPVASFSIGDSIVHIQYARALRQPQFPGGEEAMYSWIARNIRYPEEAIRDGAKGRVTVMFTVKTDGSIANVKVVRGKHPALDREAVRLVSSMPKWTPGMGKNKPVDADYVMPVTFIPPEH